MSAADALKAARDAGIRLRVDGDGLLLEASAPPSAVVLDLLLRHKAGIIPLLHGKGDGWSAEDWQAFFDERAGIAQFADSLPKAHAEAMALRCCIIEWLNRNPVKSTFGRCLSCGRGEHPNDPLLPFGADPGGHAWLHGACWPAWYRSRETEARAALSSMGIQAC
jgi:hypothetical protein